MRRLHARNTIRVNSNPDRTTMDNPVKLQIRSKSKSRWLSQSPTARSQQFVSLITIFVLLSVAVSTCYYFFVIKKASESGQRYGIIIDGGSTGSRVHVFGYRIEGGKPVFGFGEGSMRVNPGLSAYAEDPEAAGGSLVELVEFAKGRVGKEAWKETEIRLMATAGLRLLDLEIQERILEACRKVLRKSGFRFRDDWASVITGSDEGVYAWVVANYALGTLGGDPSQTTGIIELGGASAQVTFVPDEPVPPDFSRTVKYGNTTYNIYSHSFLHFGQNVAFESLKELIAAGEYQSAAESLEKGKYIDPCTPVGYSEDTKPLSSPVSSSQNSKILSSFESKGNFSECRSAALKLLQKGKDKCFYKNCQIGSAYVPNLQGKFLATENFFHTSKFFGLQPKGFLSNLMVAGQHFCGEDWSKLKSKHKAFGNEDLMRYCFSSAYIVALLHDSLGIALDDERIGFANAIGDVPLDWALGAFILQTAENMHIQHPDWIGTIITDDSPTLLSLVGIAILLMFVAWFVSKWRKPHVKTIYDLEKGRYIVTHIGRRTS